MEGDFFVRVEVSLIKSALRTVDLGSCHLHGFQPIVAVVRLRASRGMFFCNYDKTWSKMATQQYQTFIIPRCIYKIVIINNNKHANIKSR